ncbi:MAG TPA: hypothetical protein VJJ52_07705 [Candidatus Nanoarchaeia archaeon]|nr:hypothetical protein [Candidatus Nanoarchaeia archaeon]
MDRLKADKKLGEMRRDVGRLSDSELRATVEKYSELRKSPHGYHLGQLAMIELRRRSDVRLDRYSTIAQRYCNSYLLGEEVDIKGAMCSNCELINKPECPYDGIPLPFLEVIISTPAE